MAQWAGQYTGRTHRSAAADAEALLRRAIEAFRGATDEERRRKAKALVRLAERLRVVRRRLLRARADDDATLRGATGASDEVRRLDERGVAGILEEFAALDALAAAGPITPG
ncbi:MAG: hypothetical protein H6710_02185 [Myxococcales bacterium]|nr:hypothetical protein [Myxococcales bacterium]MCB9702793.1 hypothetical protein [Myxococcales bacterium]